MMAFFTENGLWAGEPRFLLTHIAPHNTPPYDQYCQIVRQHGMCLAYDGMTLEF